MLVVPVSTKTKENRYSVDPVVHKTCHMMGMWFSTMWKLYFLLAFSVQS